MGIARVMLMYVELLFNISAIAGPIVGVVTLLCLDPEWAKVFNRRFGVVSVVAATLIGLGCAGFLLWRHARHYGTRLQ